MTRPTNPRTAPTQMKTVPSGRFDFCMYGAFDVGGTEGAGYLNPPGRVGRPLGSPASSVEELIRGGIASEVAAADVAAAELVDMSGRPESVLLSLVVSAAVDWVFFPVAVSVAVPESAVVDAAAVAPLVACGIATFPVSVICGRP